jgi:MGT family glycosyltransferase
MTRVLAYTTPARGHLFPIVPTLLELRRRGHSVAVRTLSAEVDRMRGIGFDARPIDPAIEAIEHDDYRARTPLGRQRRALDVFMRRAPLDAADLRAAVAEQGADALLVDLNAWGAMTAAEAIGLPWATWMPYLLPLRSAGAPPWGPGLTPRAGRLGAVRDRIIGGPLERWLNGILTGPVTAARREAGLEPLANPARDALVRAPLMVYLTAEPMEYPRPDWPESIHMVGPGSWEPPAQAPDWLDGDDRPLVLVTVSSEYQDDAKLVATALEALRDEPVRVVATTLGADPAGFDAPPNARLERFVPHGPVIDRAVCVVCHGGMGITQKALARGVPVCIVPFGRDQHETARHVEVAAAGTRLPVQRLNAKRLRGAVRQAIRRRPGAERMAAAFAAAGGAPAAADAFEALLGDRDRRGPSRCSS